MFLKKLFLIFIIIFSATKLLAAEETNNNENQFNFFTGNFDFSDDVNKKQI